MKGVAEIEFYDTDANSPKPDAWRQANPSRIPFTAFHRLELRHAFSLAVFQNRLTPQPSTSGSRTLDILHVATAKLLGTPKFCSFDTRQAALAAWVGLTVQVP